MFTKLHFEKQFREKPIEYESAISIKSIEEKRADDLWTDVPSNENDNCGDDCGEEDESAECSQSDDGSHIQFGAVRVSDGVILHQIWNVHVR